MNLQILNIEQCPALPYPNKGRWEVSENVKYIAVTSRASKLPIFSVRLLWDLNPGLPCESLIIGISIDFPKVNIKLQGPIYVTQILLLPLYISTFDSKSSKLTIYGFGQVQTSYLSYF